MKIGSLAPLHRVEVSIDRRRRQRFLTRGDGKHVSVLFMADDACTGHTSPTISPDEWGTVCAFDQNSLMEEIMKRGERFHNCSQEVDLTQVRQKQSGNFSVGGTSCIFGMFFLLSGVLLAVHPASGLAKAQDSRESAGATGPVAKPWIADVIFAREKPRVGVVASNSVEFFYRVTNATKLDYILDSIECLGSA